jgi:23S rRNA-/tRNA-specific pseudouridylate synthase
VGDALYGVPGERLMLHATLLEFVHPVSGKPVAINRFPDFIIDK